MKYYAGIDGGQSSTQAVIADEGGRILGRGSAGPCDEVGEGPQSTRLRDALRDALANAVSNAGMPKDTRFASIVAGISGYEGRVYGAQPELPADAVALVHDTENAHAGALGGAPGVVVIAGTGSVAFARNEAGATALIGGWGFLFGDEGSAFWLARDAVADAMRESDAGSANGLGALALEHFRQPSLRALARNFYTGGISRAQFASFATAVIQFAERGNEHAAQYVRDGAAALVTLAMRAMHQTGMTSAKVAFTGGMTLSPTYSEQIAQWMTELIPQAQYVRPQYDPAVGALVLAYRRAEVNVPGVIA